MIIWKGFGNLLDEKATQLCPINAAGAMGAGLAKSVRDRWPEVYDAYRGIYQPGISPYANIHDRARVITPVTTQDGHRILLVCSKFHWKHPSDVMLIRDNLATIANKWQQWGLTELATPLLGTGLGGLPRARVEKMVEEFLGPHCRLPVKIYLGQGWGNEA